MTNSFYTLRVPEYPIGSDEYKGTVAGTVPFLLKVFELGFGRNFFQKGSPHRTHVIIIDGITEYNGKHKSEWRVT